MQGSKPTHITTQKFHTKSPWYHSQVLILVVFFLSVFQFINVMLYFSGQMAIQSTALSIQPAGCELMKRSGVSIQDIGNGACRIEALFRPNLIGAGGSIFLDNQTIQISGDQLVSTEILRSQPWTATQWVAMTLYLISALILLGSSGWLFYFLSRKGGDE